MREIIKQINCIISAFSGWTTERIFRLLQIRSLTQKESIEDLTINNYGLESLYDLKVSLVF